MKKLLILLLSLLFAIPAFADTTVTGGGGSTSLPTNCDNGQVVTWNSSTSAWDTCASAGAAAGDVTKVGTPANHQWGYWTGDGTLAGATVTASKPVCSDGNGDPAVCAGTEGVWATVGQNYYFGTTQIAINRGSGGLSIAGVKLDDSIAQFYNVAAPTKLVKIDPSNQTAGNTGVIQAPDGGTAVLQAGTMATLGANTFAGTQALGTNSLTLTGSIGATGARVTKGWFADLEITALPTINGGTLASALSVDDLITLSGVSGGDTNLGAFNETIIPDNQTIKQALQALETEVAGLSVGGDNLGTATAADVTALYTGTTGWLNADGTISTPTATDVGLGNVENTTLSTWAGSGNILTVGTIGTGAWNGSVISPVYGGTGSAGGTDNIITWTGNYGLGLTLSGATALTLPTTGTVITTLGGVAPTEGKFIVGNATPAWSASAWTMPASLAAGDVLYATAENVLGVKTKCGNNLFLGVDGTGTFGCYGVTGLDSTTFVIYDATNGTDTGVKFDTTGMSNTKFATIKPTATANVTLGTVSLGANTTLMTTMEVDGSTDQTALTAQQVTNTVIYNTGQADADVFLLLPTAAAGMNFLATVGTARAKHFGVEAAANDKIYLIAADGTVTAGDDNAGVVMTAAQVGQSFACWTFKTDAYDWQCKAISIGTSTFAAHAHSTP